MFPHLLLKSQAGGKRAGDGAMSVIHAADGCNIVGG